MEKLKQILTDHPYAIGGLIVVFGLFFLLSRRGSSAASGGNGLQIAQLETAANAQNAQVQAAQNIAATQANAAIAQVQGAVDVAQIQSNAQTAQLQTAALAKVSIASMERDLYLHSIDVAAAQQTANNKLTANLAQQAIALTNKGGRTNAGVNELALILGQGNVGSYNNYAAVQANSNAGMLASLFAGISNFASTIAAGGF